MNLVILPCQGGHCCWLCQCQPAVPLAGHFAKLSQWNQPPDLWLAPGDRNIRISANCGLCYRQCLGCQWFVIMRFLLFIYPSSNWIGYLCDSHRWHCRDWRSELLVWLGWLAHFVFCTANSPGVMDEAEITVPFTVQCSHTEVSRLLLQITMLGNSGEKILREFLTLYNFGFFYWSCQHNYFMCFYAFISLQLCVINYL